MISLSYDRAASRISPVQVRASSRRGEHRPSQRCARACDGRRNGISEPEGPPVASACWRPGANAKRDRRADHTRDRARPWLNPAYQQFLIDGCSNHHVDWSPATRGVRAKKLAAETEKWAKAWSSSTASNRSRSIVPDIPYFRFALIGTGPIHRSGSTPHQLQELIIRDPAGGVTHGLATCRSRRPR